ncbi:MAG: hypothetical protein EOP48_31040 [Sphingobacteriales bacterium]|nr:MAG: hypothetical protein EOP48_31040 [Sphingobacteriales bacterium]
MKVRDLLLNGKNFSALLQQFAVDAHDIKIQDEELIFSNDNLLNKEIVKENICIEGKNKDGVVNFFGTLHYNLLNKLAVFELQGYEQRARSLV